MCLSTLGPFIPCPLTVPSVELYSPRLFEGDTDWTDPVPVLCLVRDTSPGRHRVLWTIGEAPAPGSAEEREIEPDGSNSVRSYVTIIADQWNSCAVKCEVYNNITNVTEKVSASHRRQDNKSSDVPCRPQRPARHRTVQDYSVIDLIQGFIYLFIDKEKERRYLSLD
ncbi:UNVERIFIED_CONTAM: hypothetical protein FKN15_008529 [Acipenser sinensis]